jgi:acetyl esterase/lipase
MKQKRRRTAIVSSGPAILLVAIILFTTLAEAGPWDPGPGHEQISIWPKEAPDSPRTSSLPESMEVGTDPGRWGSKPVTGIYNVSQPTITVYPPQGANTGAAVVVFPGGGYRQLAIDLEGTEVCEWLTARGITCVLLKYRVPNSGCHWDPELKRHVVPKVFTALQDAQRAIGLVRHDAAKWKIDPKKIGVIGFSAGGNLVAAISTNHKKRIYPHVDAADSESCRPDFAMALYAGHMSVNHDDLSKLNPGLPVTSDTPPTFLVQATDDPVDPVEYSLLYYAALKKAKVPVEMHLYAQGGHAFALRRSDLPVSHWTDLADAWLGTIGVLPKK